MHENYMKKDFVEDYEIVRGPRPWELQDEFDKAQEWEEKRKNNRIVPKVVKRHQNSYLGD